MIKMLYTNYIKEEINAIEKLDYEQLNRIASSIKSCEMTGFKIYVIGNGGSSTTASHFSNDINKFCNQTLNTIGDRAHSICLSDNTATITAIANDVDYSEVFSYQLANYACKSDILIALSGSGNSKNIVNAVKYANELGMQTIVLTGKSGGEVSSIAKEVVKVESNDMQIIEDVHLSICHIICKIISRGFSTVEQVVDLF